ncbi:NifB/NifX family molybdenum-iron cluster-binding protein [uncultured Ruminococcus sp.]|uniref:NifB/NifX family molybdenum-iron cluster-binding protein n=1 Tax=uncultured Ruminococcus sp. TaxID=165186 RepID=UPI0034521DF5
MKIAVTYENGNVFQHFGRTEQFKIYEILQGKIVKSQIVSTNGNGHGALAGILSEQKVDTLICGGIGAGAQTALANARIQLYGGVSGNADAAVEQLLTGTLVYNPDVQCNHHNHHDVEHSCGGNHGNCHAL